MNRKENWIKFKVEEETEERMRFVNQSMFGEDKFSKARLAKLLFNVALTSYYAAYTRQGNNETLDMESIALSNAINGVKAKAKLKAGGGNVPKKEETNTI